jgi:phage terminase small subunit
MSSPWLTLTYANWVHQCLSAGVAEVAAAQLWTLAVEFGLTPSIEQRLASFTPDGDDDGKPFAG